jgi:argininosuccinate lyase
MEYLIGRKIPHRTAHHAVGRLVRLAMEKQIGLAELSLAEFQAIDPSLDNSIYDVLGVENALRAFRSAGSTAPDKVAEQISDWRRQLQQ